ncbi:MAG: threonine dehydratase [Rhodospirillaceae bacterium]|nr:threonine dehydratase [Rhodospirillaceae bacterium]|tara:strand:- start:7853 stop:9088 length:1236 start_codon:yes stop_codon:yes gene_type:complete
MKSLNQFQKRILQATLEMRKVFEATPIQKNEHLSRKYNANIYLKREDLSPVRSYKVRGACNAMRKQNDVEHFVCASAGNHAQGVAFMASFLGVKATIFMPITTPQQKISKTQIFGGNNVKVSLVGDYFDECLAAAQEFSLQNAAYFLSPFDDIDVIEGQATVASEIKEQLNFSPDMIIMPVGGGGLSAGAISFFGNECEYTLVEPHGATSLKAALSAGKPKRLDEIDNFTDGASVAMIGRLNFEILKKIHPDCLYSVPENRICTTMLEMLDIEGIVLEPAGALSIDVLKDIPSKIAGRNIVCVATGGNFDFERLPEVKERAGRFSGIKKYLILSLPQRPGALRDFLKTLGPNEDITRFEYLKKSARNFGSILIGLETKGPEDFKALFSRLDEGEYKYKDITEDQILSQFLI